MSGTPTGLTGRRWTTAAGCYTTPAGRGNARGTPPAHSGAPRRASAASAPQGSAQRLSAAGIRALRQLPEALHVVLGQGPQQALPLLCVQDAHVRAAQ